MADDKGVKSAYELAMERFKRQDKEAGLERKPLTDQQKAAIAEARNYCEAKLAEQEVLHQSRMRRTADPASRDTLEQEYRRERERLTSEREAKVAKIRAQ